MSASLSEQILERIAARLGHPVLSVTSVAGGDISAAFKITVADGPPLFLKWRRGAVEILDAERTGLEALRTAGSGLVVPRCVAHDSDLAGGGYLALEWIDATASDHAYWQTLGDLLSRLHRVEGARYGFDSDNFIGRLPQSNAWSSNWVEFFLEKRLEPQIEMAKERGRWQPSWQQRFERMAKRLPDMLPRTPAASLVHGDLWSGNVMSTSRGAAIFDPAVYYGDREVDLAMTKLFGGFSVAFEQAYRQAWPLDSGFEERVEIYNLYHLINHLNHFGVGYAGQVDRVLKRFA